jgi:hypothetical protein
MTTQAGGTTMLSWPDALCATLARGGRRAGEVAAAMLAL